MDLLFLIELGLAWPGLDEEGVCIPPADANHLGGFLTSVVFFLYSGRVLVFDGDGLVFDGDGFVLVLPMPCLLRGHVLVS